MIAVVIIGGAVLITAACGLLAGWLADRAGPGEPFTGAGLAVTAVEGYDAPEIHHEEYGFLPAPMVVPARATGGRGRTSQPAARIMGPRAALHGEPSYPRPGTLPSPAAPALAVLAALTAPIRQALDVAEQAKAAAWEAHVRETSPWADREPFTAWLSDDTITRGLQAVR